MSKWIDFSSDERLVMIQNVAKSLNIDELAVEKDWWVTAVLQAVFRTKAAKYLLFKGGTSLSKGWDFINRFSEDVDLALNRTFFLKELGIQCANCNNKTQIHNLREKGQDYIYGTFKEELKKQLANLKLDVNILTEQEATDNHKIPHDKDPSVIYIEYPSIYNLKNSYTIPRIKLEISVLSMSEPYEKREIQSLIEKYFEGVDDDLVQIIPIVSPSRTFLEKAFLLCEEYQRKQPRTRRMTRHFYDLERLMDTSYAKKALKDRSLYHSVVDHRRKFYALGYVNYYKDLPGRITIVPKEELLPLYKADYDEMKKSFIYGKTLDFEDLIGRLKELQKRFRAIAHKPLIINH